MSILNFFSTSSLKLICLILIFLASCIAYSCSQPEETEEFSHTFVGDKTCQSCHAAEWEEWQSSHHDYAMAEVSEEMVRADFNNTTFQDGDDTYHFYRENGKYMVEAPGPEGEQEQYEIKYTFGWEPLQQYLVDFGKGKYQALHVAWDTEKKTWFSSLYPDQHIEPGEWLHWTGQALNWNTMCADCHSTNLKQNFIPEADSFHTTWDVINVSCEACHGPGGDHVNFMNSEEAASADLDRIRQDLNLKANSSQIEEINTCAPCHSRREKLNDEYIHGNDFLDHYDPALPVPEEYFADGQIKGEVFEYASFLQSKMYAMGVKCSDCHDPHSLRLKESVTDNKLCMQCHTPSYDSPDHHFHEMNTEASQCISCHMTGKNFMEIDFRRDHSFRVPRPDLSEEFDTPNACNSCHEDQSLEWASKAIVNWYGAERESAFSEVLAKTQRGENITTGELEHWINDITQPELIRATLVWYAGQFPSDENSDLIFKALESQEPIIRASAVKAMEQMPAGIRQSFLADALKDSMIAVRIPAIRALAEFNENDFEEEFKNVFRDAVQEYKTYLDINDYFPQAQMNRGQFYEQQGEIDKAIEAYQKTLEKDPEFNPARINLAYIYNRQEDNSKAEELLKIVIDQEPEFGQAYYSLGLLMAEQDQLNEAVRYFEQAAERMPEHHRVFYNLAIAYQTLNRSEEAESAYRQAIELAPENGDYRYGLITLYMQQEQFKEAYGQAEILDSLHPNNPQVQQLLQMIEQRMN
ncbi:MAG: tetratricopeptide repeat protein [Balneolaceae bacterium]